MVYEDFDLLIDRSGDSFRAQVLNSPGGQASAEFRLPFSEDKLENYLLRLGRTRRATRRVESQEMNTAKTFGAALFDAVFTGDVKACFRSSIDEVRQRHAGLRIRLRLGDPGMADLPWEFLYNRSVNRFIALSVQTPVVRYMDLPEQIQPIAVELPIRVLVMIPSPIDFPSLDVEAEWTRLHQALSALIAANQIALERVDDATLESLQRRLRRASYHIFHFIGHGEFDQDQQEGVLILEAENRRGHKVGSQFLGMLLHDHESLRLAILNACEGARTSRTDPFAGSAQSLVQQGIPAVIAMQFEIADDVASWFAHEFYGALANGYPVDASLTEARKSIFAAGHEVEWGTPVLYLRAPDGRIFDIQARGGQSRPPAASIPHAPEPWSAAARDERLDDAIVAAAQEAFAGGRRVEAIEMLHRHDPARPRIGEALRQLTLEHQRLLAERREKEAREQQRTAPEARRVDHNVRFTVYRPAVMVPLREYLLLLFTHLAERRRDAPADQPDPIAEVERLAGESLRTPAASVVIDAGYKAGVGIPHEALLRIIPSAEGLRFNPPEYSFMWLKDVHRALFEVSAAASMEGRIARGSIDVMMGVIPVASITVAIPVEARASRREPAVRDVVQPFRRIFASYSQKDTAIVRQFENYALAMGDRYMRDVVDLRAGEIWRDRLIELIDAADVFQLFWSTNSMTSPFVRREWEHALLVDKPYFVRPLYWESPFPECEGLPPPELRARHFANVSIAPPVVEPGRAMPEARTESPAAVRPVEPPAALEPTVLVSRQDAPELGVPRARSPRVPAAPHSARPRRLIFGVFAALIVAIAILAARAC